MIFTVPNAVRFRTSGETSLAGIVETTKMRNVYTILFRKRKARKFWLSLVHYIKWVWKEEDLVVRSGYGRPEVVQHRRDELEFIV
jgi:hypothetical protein